MRFCYHVDFAGPVPVNAVLPDDLLSASNQQIGNKDIEPEWILELYFTSANIHYGPWADRQRCQIQNFFFPFVPLDSIVNARLEPGQARLHTQLKVRIEFSKGTSIRVPLREQSKDWKYANLFQQDDSKMASPTSKDDKSTSEPDGQVRTSLDYNSAKSPTTAAITSRPYAWIDIKMSVASTVKMTVPMIVSENGYKTTLDCQLNKVIVTTSLNYAVLIDSPSFCIRRVRSEPNGKKKF